MDREPLKATFYAFRKRERRGVMRRAFLLHGFNALALVTIGVALPLLVAASAPGSVAGLSPDVSGWLLVLSLVLIVLLYQLNAASFEAACLRWLIRQEQRGAFGAALDRDTWRIFFSGWLWLAVYLALWLLVFALAAAVAIPFRDSPRASLYVPLIFFSILGVLALLVTVLFGSGNAVGLARRKLGIFDGRKASKGRFWALLGSWAIASVIWLIVAVVMLFSVGLMLAMFARGLITVSSGFVGVMSLIGATLATRLVLTPFFAGINARTVLAAADEGAIEDFRPSDSIARVFE